MLFSFLPDDDDENSYDSSFIDDDSEVEDISHDVESEDDWQPTDDED